MFIVHTQKYIYIYIRIHAQTISFVHFVSLCDNLHEFRIKSGKTYLGDFIAQTPNQMQVTNLRYYKNTYERL